MRTCLKIYFILKAKNFSIRAMDDEPSMVMAANLEKVP